MPKKRSHIVPISIVLALLLSLGCYVFDNQPYSSGEGLGRLCILESIIHRLFDREEISDDAFFINVAYDRQIASYSDDMGPHGNVDITDRVALLDLLDRLERFDNYKYIFLDIRFESGVTTDTDSALFHKIAGMRDIVVANHSDIVLADPILEPKSALSDFSSSGATTDFYKYQYLQKRGESVALRIYRSLTGKTIGKTKIPFIYSCDGRICRNSLFLRFSKRMTDQENGSSEVNFYDLGPQLNEWVDDDALSTFVDGRFVFVGDFVNDVHDTSYGEQPGPYINYVALEYLLADTHLIKIWFLVLMSIVYAILFYISLSGLILHFNIESKVLSYLATLGTYTVVLFVVNILVFILSKNTYNVFIPGLVFSAIDAVKKK